MNMTNKDIIPYVDHFIMFDALDTKSEDVIVKDYPSVQIVDPSNNNSFQNIQVIKSRVKNVLKVYKNKHHLLTITLQVDKHFKPQMFR
jgi:hypothetical protein